MVSAFIALSLAQGLTSIDAVLGKGAVAEAGDTVTVTYKGNLTDGKVFDSSENKPPLAFVLGKGQVIKGWDDGVRGMRVGGTRFLSIPPTLGYGDRPLGDVIPANSTLIFEVKLLRVDKEKDEQVIAIEDSVVGTGAEVVSGKTVEVHYRGLFLNGKQFDASYDRGTPLSVKAGGGQVIKGFDQGLIGMRVGGKRRVTIPYKLGYGENGRPPIIPSRSTLVFELEIVSVK
ncbi:MAG TPA: FKBP-type peptidyl-prolyl cis-trans isomerase [Fimbriimonadaceae bacterium]|nr:FKBP-type peptidyl-prolyl cis-trans isomerase [Fimbriimonadaceae bacterium]